MKNIKIENILVFSLLGISIFFTVVGLFSGENFWDWAWARHENTLSWFIRPLFIPLLVYFSYKRNWLGIFSVGLATLTSMYWFPAPASPNEQVADFLIAEQEYLQGTWDIGKIMISSIVPISLGALIYAFWKRSIWAGLIVVNLIALIKILWSVVYEKDSGWIIIPFALVGLAISDVAIMYFIKRVKAPASKL